MNNCVNLDRKYKKIKPLHAVNNIPKYGINGNELFDMCMEAVPMVRFHDTAFISPYNRFVDIPAIFRDFDADENDPASYDFVFTDSLIRQVINSGVKVFYRLGVSIENFVALKKYHLDPPKDFEKWARICEHIIAHYNEGWANGFNYGIEYWEIWNEPENYHDLKGNQMWNGSFEEYCELYKVSARHLKNRFPSIKIGGYASCGFYSILEDSTPDKAKVPDITANYYTDCVHKFLQYVSSEENKSPLDFFSWHSYSGVESNIKYVNHARKVLDDYGFTNTESILNEWNIDIGIRGTSQDASNIAYNMIALQNTPIDLLMYYDSRVTTVYGGMFSQIGDAPNANIGKALPAYYVFKAFDVLYKMGEQVDIDVHGEKVFALAAENDGKVAILITNNKETEQVLELSSYGNIEKICSITDKNKLDAVEFSDNYTMSAYETLLIYTDGIK